MVEKGTAAALGALESKALAATLSWRVEILFSQIFIGGEHVPLLAAPPNQDRRSLIRSFLLNCALPATQTVEQRACRPLRAARSGLCQWHTGEFAGTSPLRRRRRGSLGCVGLDSRRPF